MNEKIKVIYIGDHFYMESGTMMSCLYLEDGSRYDYGFMKRDLLAGKAIIIRPATDAEIGQYERKLRAFKAKRAERAAPDAGVGP